MPTKQKTHRRRLMRKAVNPRNPKKRNVSNVEDMHTILKGTSLTVREYTESSHEGRGKRCHIRIWEDSYGSAGGMSDVETHLNGELFEEFNDWTIELLAASEPITRKKPDADAKQLRDAAPVMLEALRMIRGMREESTTAPTGASGGVACTEHRFYSGDPERGYTFDTHGYTKAVEEACDQAIAQAAGE